MEMLDSWPKPGNMDSQTMQSRIVSTEEGRSVQLRNTGESTVVTSPDLSGNLLTQGGEHYLSPNGSFNLLTLTSAHIVLKLNTYFSRYSLFVVLMSSCRLFRFQRRY